MIVHCIVMSCCLLAQAADSPPTRLPPAKASPRRHQPAAAANPPADGVPAAAGGGGSGRSAYEPAATEDHGDRSQKDFNAGGGTAGDRQGDLGQVEPGERRLRPPELLAAALSGPHQGSLPVRPLPLVDAFARATDREQQRQIALAYWRLSIAQAQRHFAHDNLEHLRRWTHPGQKHHSSLTDSQLATAQAAIEDAEFRVINEGEALATLIGWGDKDEIPATVDRPHVGAYRTEFERLFSSNAPPPRMRLIDRTLPISRRAIDVHGTALVAADDALKATEEEYQRQKTDYLTLTAAFDRLVAEQTAFLASVLRYNEDIADYALFVAPATADGAFLAKRLITRPAPATQPKAEPPRAEPSPSDQPDTAEESFNTNSTGRERRPRTFLEPSTPARDDSRDDPSATAWPRARLRLVGVETAAEPSAETAHGGLYQGLIGQKPAIQAERLTASLHWDIELPADAGEKLTLVDCLGRIPQTKRRAAIAAYWNTREQVARYQVLGEQSESLTALFARTLALRAMPGGPEAMLRLQATREAARAAVLDQHIRLLTAQFELLLLLGSPPDRPWPLPSTAPHGGVYRIAKSDSGHNHAGQQPPPGGADTRLIVLHNELANRASAVVFADEFRAVHTTAEPRRPGEIDNVLWAIDRQLRKTEVFLATLTDYNLAVADFVLPRLPADTPAKGVVERLVVEPTGGSDT